MVYRLTRYVKGQITGSEVQPQHATQHGNDPPSQLCCYVFSVWWKLNDLHKVSYCYQLMDKSKRRRVMRRSRQQSKLAK